MSAGEYDYEPVPGLPEPLPAGECLLWQGQPAWLPLARRALRIVPLSLYFMLLALWQASSAWSAQHSALAVRHAVTLPLLLGGTVLAMLAAVAWLSARATRYTVTNRRVVIRHGIALSMSLNLPFAQVQSAALSLHRDGTGEIALTLPKRQRVGYLLTWPHVRPGRYVQPQPSLRAIPDAAHVAQILSAALRAHALAAPVPDASAAAVPSIIRVAPARRPSSATPVAA